MNIKDLNTNAWGSAIDNATVIINTELGINFNRSNWYIIEVLIEQMGIKFDKNGDIINVELIAKVGERYLYRVKGV